MRKLAIIIILASIVFGISRGNIFAKCEHDDANHLTRTMAIVTETSPEYPNNFAFIEWHPDSECSGNTSAIGYTKTSNWHRQDGKLTFDVVCRERYCPGGSVRLEVARVKFIAVMGGFREPSGVVIKITGIEGDIIITNPDIAFLVVRFGVQQRQ